MIPWEKQGAEPWGQDGVQGRSDVGEDLGVTSWRGGGDVQDLVAVQVAFFGDRFGVRWSWGT